MNIEKINGFWVPSNDIHVEQWRQGQAFTQNKCLREFIKWCQSRDKKFNTVLDIGAWCGTWSAEFAPYCKKIYAIEPDRTHFECLIKNLSSFDNIELLDYAVGDTETRVSLTDDDFTQARRIYSVGNIPMKTVDSFQFKNVDLIKIDVEGFEMNVLCGAKDTLKDCSFLMIELNNNSKKYNSSNAEIEKYLQQIGFTTLINQWPDKIFVNTTKQKN
jgi:FkbM family methyltransferase